MSAEFDIEYKTIIELRRMTQPQLVAYTRKLQEALFELTEEKDE